LNQKPMMSDYFEMHGYYDRCPAMIEGAASCCLSINYSFL